LKVSEAIVDAYRGSDGKLVGVGELKLDSDETIDSTDAAEQKTVRHEILS
jgi:hypothetical protein